MRIFLNTHCSIQQIPKIFFNDENILSTNLICLLNAQKEFSSDLVRLVRSMFSSFVIMNWPKSAVIILCIYCSKKSRHVKMVGCPIFLTTKLISAV